MPTKREREYYRMGFEDGVDYAKGGGLVTAEARRYLSGGYAGQGVSERYSMIERGALKPRKTKRKLSAWNKFVKANSKKPRFRYRNGKLNLKKMAVSFRKTPAGRKKRR